MIQSPLRRRALLMVVAGLLMVASTHPGRLSPAAFHSALQDRLDVVPLGIVEQLAAREYEIRPAPDREGLQSPNRAQGLRFRYRADGFSIEPRQSGADSWSVGVFIEAVTVGSTRLEPTANAALRVQGARLEVPHAGFTVIYENQPAGMRQSFVVDRPAGPGPAQATDTLSVGLRMSDNVEVAPSGGGVALVDRARREVRAYYRDLHVWDATGRVLPARMELHGQRMDLVVDTEGARFPITVDPISTSPSWEQPDPTGVQPGPSTTNEHFGFSVAGVGDVNGDGYDDVAVGAPDYRVGAFLQGAVYLYYGAAGGPSSALAAPPWLFPGMTANDRVGVSVAAAGDINADGYADFIVGAFGAKSSLAEGEAYVFYGSPSGPIATPWSSNGVQALSWYGYAVAGAGDLNGDGYDDAAIGSPGFDANGQDDVGRVVVYLGSATGLSATPAWELVGTTPNAKLGWSVALIDDVNGNGSDELAIGEPGVLVPVFGLPTNLTMNDSDIEGSAYLYDGTAITGGGPVAPLWQRQEVFHNFGRRVANGGDIDGDGCGDLLVGDGSYPVVNSSGFDIAVGVVHAYYGGQGGVCTGPNGQPDWESLGKVPPASLTNSQFGMGLAGGSDVNADGYDDLIVGSPFAGIFPDAVHVYFGSATGLGTSLSSSGYPEVAPDWSVTGPREKFGSAVAGAGDTDSDGIGEVLIGAYRFGSSIAAQHGYAVMYEGLPAGLQEPATWTAPGVAPSTAQSQDMFGFSVDNRGDIDGDGYDDVLVGAPWFDAGGFNTGAFAIYRSGAAGLPAPPSIVFGSQPGARLGYSIAFVGDIDDDGIDDFAVSSPHQGTGEVSVYSGSATAPNFNLTWSSGQVGGGFGSRVIAAGDLNGDGVADLAIGAPWANVAGNTFVNEGAVYIYHGGAAGLPPIASTTLAGPASGSRFGNALAGGGDVTGDGSDDLLVGAPFFTDGEFHEGGAFLFAGPLLPTPAPSWSWATQGDQVGAQLGKSVALVGAVNGDGEDDLLIGAPSYDYTSGWWLLQTTLANAGRATIHYGGLGGPAASPSWARYGPARGARYGQVVAGGGNFNGDGFADIVVGSPLSDAAAVNAGAVYSYYGSALGPKGHSGPAPVVISAVGSGLGDPAWTAFGVQPYARFGWAMAGGGDLNADGLDDLVIGAPSSVGPSATGNGEIFLYLSQR